MSLSFQLARILAHTFLAGELEEEAMVARAGRVLGRRYRGLRPLARNTVQKFGLRTRPAEASVAQYLLSLRQLEDTLWAISDHDDRDASWRGCYEPHFIHAKNLLQSPKMLPAGSGPDDWLLPQITTVAELAQWFGVSLRRLLWLSNESLPRRSYAERGSRHYHVRWVPKRSGGLRLIESPKPQLKAMQRELLHQLLDRIPPHAAAHGFHAGRSIKTFAEPHANQRVVIRIDLTDFFATVTAARVWPVFRTAGYPEPVAKCLAGLCTSRLSEQALKPLQEPKTEADTWRFRLYRESHLPQGAPTSPSLANLVAYRLDCRLAALAEKSGGVYTRYADDLAFSGDERFARSAKRFVVQAMSICHLEGFHVHPRKTRIMRANVRQQLAGVVVNDRPNVRRADVDRLKATLFNCLKHGPASQNRSGHANFRAHLAGSISHLRMLNPERGEKLQRLFEQIDWNEVPS